MSCYVSHTQNITNYGKTSFQVLFLSSKNHYPYLLHLRETLAKLQQSCVCGFIQKKYIFEPQTDKNKESLC